MRMWVIMCVGPHPDDWALAALARESLLMQNFKEWHCMVVLDDWARPVPEWGPHFSFTVNTTRRYVVRNTVNAIRSLPTKPEDIIVILDGDDHLARPDALRLVFEEHESGAWVTYGSWISNYGPGFPLIGPNDPYTSGELANVRQAFWKATHLRTFRAGLFSRIAGSDFQWSDGSHFRYCPDQAIMIPAIEMSPPERVSFIEQPLVLYNRANPRCAAELDRAEQRRTSEEIRRRPRYGRINEL